MANPWDNDPIAGGSNNFWDADPIDEAPKKKKVSAKDVLPTQEEQENVLSNIQGLGESALNLITGAIGGGLGTLAGTIAGIKEHGIGTDAARKATEAEAARRMEELTFQPRTEKGKEIAGRTGQVMEQLIPIMPMAAELEGAALAGKRARSVQNQLKAEANRTFAPDVPLPLDKALEQADVLPENQKQVLGPQPQWFDADPIVEPARAGSGRQMEFNFEAPNPETPITVTPQGEALRTPQDVAAYEQFGRKPEEAPAPLGQGDLFMNEEVSGPIATPFNAAERGVLPDMLTENPALARRQMELQLADQEPIHVTGEGVATRGLPEPMRTITESPEQIAAFQRDAEARVREAQAKAAVENGETGNLFPDYVNKHRDFELFRDENGKPLNRRDFDETIKNLEKEPGSVYTRPENMDLAYQRYLENFEGVQAGLFDTPTTALEMSNALKKDAVQRQVDSHPLVKAAEKHLSQETQFLEQLKQQGATLEAIKDAVKDVEAATRRVEKTRENVLGALEKGTKPSPLRRKQRGGVSHDFLTSVLSLGMKDMFSKKGLNAKRVEIVAGENKNQYLPKGIQKGLEDYTKERRSAEDIIADIQKNNIPDIKSTPLSDKVQAGGLYKGLETNNPIVRKTFAAISDAYNKAHANIREAIQDPKNGLPALFRNLSKKEAADIWSFMTTNEGKNQFTTEQLRSQGFNDKQIKLYERFREIDNFALAKINQARANAGKDPITPRIGHLAGQASGDFRKLIFKTNKDGAKEIVGIVGSDIKHTLDKRVKAILEKHPEWSAGEQTMVRKGKRDNRQKAFEDAVEFLAENNPDTRALLDTYDRILKDDAYNYMNAKKHTMNKKGIHGTEGFALDRDAWTNAKEGMSSQIRYLEKMLNWSELSNAVGELRPLLADERVNMPNAKKWASDYVDRALGIQHSDIGAAVDGLITAVGNNLGVGPSAISRGVGGAKNVISKTLLGFMNPGFLMINMMQPAMATPAINSLLRSRGIKNASATIMPKALLSATKIMTDRMGKLTPFEQQIKDQGYGRGIFGGHIFEHGANLTKGKHYLNKIAEFGIPSVEASTRGSVFTAYAHILNDAGIPKSKLWDIAENLTNQTMTDYRPIEAPSMYKEMGSIGEMAVTLQRYKHNSLSNIAMLAREAKRNKEFKPIATAMLTGLAFSGLTGMLGFNEADAIYQMATKAMGKPDTLTRLLVDNVKSDTLNYGAVSALTNIDFSKRFGMNLFPDSPSGALFPGVSRLGEMAGSAIDLAKNPTSETQWARAARDMAPNSIRGALERKFFEDDSGLAHNPKTLAGTVQRNETDKAAKSVGLTGLHESKEKNRLYQENLVDKAYAEKRTSTVNKIFTDLYPLRGNPEAIAEYFQSPRGQELRQTFTENEGNIDNLVSSVIKFQRNTKLTAMQQRMLAASAARKEGDLKRAKRYVDMKEGADE